MHSRVANSTLRAVHACNISECSRSRKMCTYTTREQHKYNTRACVTLHLSSTVVKLIVAKAKNAKVFISIKSSEW